MDLFQDTADGGLSCDEFRELHGDYLDGLLRADAAARVEHHAGQCADCARYDRIVRRGLELARELPEVEPSEDFQLRLQHRIFHLQDATPLAAQRPLAGVGVAAAVAGMIALIAWSPLLLVKLESVDGIARHAADEFAPPLVVPLPVAGPHGVEGMGWIAGQFPGVSPYDAGGRPSVFPGPYSPLIVYPPAHGSVRTVSTEYRVLE